MTAWQSMFAAGACTVAVQFVGTTLWSGPLTFNQSSPPILGNGGSHYVVSIDANGVVTLTTPDNAPAAGVTVEVFPQYDTSQLQTQVAAISGFGAVSNEGYASADTGPSTQLAFDPVTGASTPSAVTFGPHAPATGGAYVLVETFGGA